MKKNILKYILFILIFPILISCSVIPDNFKELEKTSETIISKTDIIHKDVKTLKQKAVEFNCNQEVIDQANDIEFKIVELEGEQQLLKKNIQYAIDSYKQEIKEYKNKIRIRDVIIGFLVIYLIYRFLIKLKLM